MERRKKAATESGALLLVVGLILVAVNALSFFMYFRKDATKAEKYTLSEGSGRLLRNMKGEMKAEAYVTKGLPKLDSYVREWQAYEDLDDQWYYQATLRVLFLMTAGGFFPASY